MVAVRSTNAISQFSNCSIASLQTFYQNGKHFCLTNKPETVSTIPPNCGNGIVEPGEDCDCGIFKYCENSCCDALSCKFKANSKCATGKCCDLTVCQ